MTTTESDIYSRICVRRPYYAYSDLAVTEPGHVTATVPAETPNIGPEPIALHEFIRHGAILGLCSVASLSPRDERRYYLAQVGTVAWLVPNGQRATKGPLVGAAHGTLISNRRGKSEVYGYSNDQPLVKLTVEFGVFSERAFARAFANLHRPELAEPEPDANPYILGLALQDRAVHDNNSAASATITANTDQCAGHFDGYPAIPVAVIIRAAIELGGYLVNTADPYQLWEPTDGDLHPISQLVPAGQKVTLNAEIIHATPTSRLVRISFTVDDSDIGHVTFQYMPTTSPVD